jgi:hypothetical protein
MTVRFHATPALAAILPLQKSIHKPQAASKGTNRLQAHQGSHGGVDKQPVNGPTLNRPDKICIAGRGGKSIHMSTHSQRLRASVSSKGSMNGAPVSACQWHITTPSHHNLKHDRVHLIHPGVRTSIL